MKYDCASTDELFVVGDFTETKQERTARREDNSLLISRRNINHSIIRLLTNLLQNIDIAA